MTDFTLDFPSPLGKPVMNAGFRVHNADFFVDEQAGFTPGGSGEHVFLHIEKDGENTGWLAKEIATLARVKENDVGYAGLKDRHAITRQWFSVYLPKGPEPDWRELNRPGVQLLAVSRHSQKLRRGQHTGNRFCIRLRQVSGDREVIQARLNLLKLTGTPNYFGPQRFGRSASNLVLAEQWLVGGQVIKHRQKKSFALSAARAWLFNQVLDLRVRNDSWQTCLNGDQPHVAADGKMYPTGPLWGRGRPPFTDEALSIMQAALEPWQSWADAMEFTGLKQETRSLVLMPGDFSWQWLDADLQLDFTLPAGAFATALVYALMPLPPMGPSQVSGE
ncbi:MAG TPA: tRNA pseudouridine(13) synthase TruD [Cellvibrionaceae bacterium]